MLKGLNHITLAVSDVDESLRFYLDVLGFIGHVKWDSGAYLTLRDLWLCLSLDQLDEKSDYSHIAFDVADTDFSLLVAKLNTLGIPQWKTNKSEGKSVYIIDPNGHKLEIHVGDLSSRLKCLKNKPYSGLVWL